MKILRKMVGILTAMSMLGSMAVTTLAADSSSEYIYENAFDTQAKVDELTLVGSGKLGGEPTMAFSEEKGCMYTEGWGQNAGWLFPESVKTQNFVAEGDVVYEKKSDYRDRDIAYGFFFGYQSDTNFTNVAYYPLNGNVRLWNVTESGDPNRTAEKGRGASFTVADNETAHLKLVVNNGQLEFFVNDELCYSYFSNAEKTGALNPSRDFTAAGRLGFFCNADKTMITLKNFTVREIKNTENTYYTNTFMSSPAEDGTTLKGLSGLSEHFKDSGINDGKWGSMDCYGMNFDSAGRYIDQSLTGNYSADLNFAFLKPQQAYSHISFMLGYDKTTNKYIVADVNLRGGMSIVQKEIVDDGGTLKEQEISGAKATYNGYQNTIPENKKDKIDAEDDFILSYMPDGYNSEDPTDVLPRRHNLHLEVVNGEVRLTFEGQTLKCTPDVVSTDGYFGYILTGTNAKLYSLRVAPLPKTTMTEDYTEIGATTTSADVIVSDGENILTNNSVVVLAVYKGDELIGMDIKSVSEKDEDDTISLETNYTNQEDTTDLVAMAFLWKDSEAITPMLEPLMLGNE